MVDRSRRVPHWRRTKLNLLSAILFPVALAIAVPFALERLADQRILGLPIEVFLIVHVATIAAVFFVVRFVRNQAAVDRWHGTHEDF